MEKASTGTYILAWFIVAVLNFIVNQLVGSFVGTELYFVFQRPNQYLDHLIGITAFSSVCYVLTTLAVYSQFPSLNYKKVVPYIWILGGLGSLSSIGQASQIIDLNDDNELLFAVSSIVIAFFMILLITAKLKNWQNETERTQVEAEERKRTELEREQNKQKEILQKKMEQEVAEEKRLERQRALELVEQEKQKAIELAEIERQKQAEIAEVQEPKRLLSEESSKGILSEYPDASSLIEYLPEAEKAWSAVSSLPNELQRKFLEALSQPSANPEEVALTVYDVFLERQPHDASEELSQAFDQVRRISTKAEEAFSRLYEMQGERIPVSDIVELVVERHGGPAQDRVKAFDYFKTLSNKRADKAEQERLEQEAAAEALYLELLPKINKNWFELKILEGITRTELNSWTPEKVERELRKIVPLLLDLNYRIDLPQSIVKTADKKNYTLLSPDSVLVEHRNSREFFIAVQESVIKLTKK